MTKLLDIIHSLRSKIIFYFGILFLFVILLLKVIEIYGIPFTNVVGSYQHLHQEIVYHLNLIADLKQDKLQGWVKERIDDATLISKSELINDILSEFAKNNQHHSLFVNDELKSVLGQKSYKTLYNHLNLIKSINGIVSKIQIINKSNSCVMVSTEMNEYNKKLENSNLLKIIHSHEGIVSSEILDDSISSTGLLLARKFDKKMSNNDFVLLIYINQNDLLTPFLHTGDRLGKSGEVLLINNDRVILHHLKHPLANGNIAEPLKCQMSTLPASYAAMGKQGYMETKDYRDADVLAAYRYIQISDQSGWGMVVKIDKNEAFHLLWDELESDWIFVMIAMIVIMIFSYILATNLSKPIKDLSIVAKKIEDGNMSSRVQIFEHGELAYLTKSFNSMADKLENWQNKLELEVKQRTKELEILNKKLKREIMQRKKTEEQIKENSLKLEEKVKDRTIELEDKANKFEQSQKAMTYLLEDINEIRCDLEKANKDLEEANKELESFSYSISHDLRTPLRAINGFSKKIMDQYNDKFDDEALRLFNIIRSNASKMGDLIDALLSFSRLGRKHLMKNKIDMHRLAKEVYDEIIKISPEKEIKLVLKQLPSVNGDQALIRQVLINLISNAIKFAKNNKPVIEIGANENQEYNIYYIKDNGVGFNMKYADKLFGVFQRLHGESEFPGTGVGLALVQRIIHRHNGKIWAVAEENKGATFYFSLSKNGEFA